MKSDTKTWAVFCHLCGLLGYIVPFGNIAGPIIIWAIKGKEMPSLEKHYKEALNFQISMTIYMMICFILTFLLIGFILFPIIIVLDIIFIIKAALAANKGQLYHYPLTIHLVK
jgi:uncharacterized protein